MVYAVMTQAGGVTESDWTWAEWEDGFGEDGKTSNPVTHRTEAGALAALPTVAATCNHEVSVRPVNRWSGTILKD